MLKINLRLKNLVFIFSFAAVLFICTAPAQAATEDDETIRQRYSGSVVIEDRKFEKLYWYIEPNTQEKYLLKNGDTLSRIIKNISRGIDNDNLNKLPTNDEQENIDWQLTHRLRGNFLLQVEEGGQVWYLNPLDQKLYAIANGKEGLETLQNLAIELDKEKLNLFAENKELNIRVPAMPAVDFSIYWDVWNSLKMDHYKAETLNDVDRFYGSLKGMADALGDSYTQFFTPQNNQFFQENLEGSVEGIGAIVDVVDDVFIIVSPLNESPAKKAGLESRDQVLSVDGIDIKGFSAEDTISLIRGQKGTNVKLEIYRPSTKKTFFVDITRDRVDVPFVEYEKLDNNIAYIKIHMFTEDIVTEFKKAREAVIDEKTTGVIIDLRNNPGGYTTSVRQIAALWLDPGDKIYSEQYRDIKRIYTAYSDAEIKLPTVILTNQGTASASEIFTGALKDHGLAQTVGETSFGKGSGQTIRSFSDGSALKYTIFEWLTPLDNSVEGKGLEPDFEIKNTPKNDLQLLKAKKLLQ